MATTEFTTAATERVELWAKRLWIEMPREIYWGKFMREDMNAIIEVKRDLEGGPGDKLIFTLATKLSGDGVDDDGDLEGQEEQMNVYSDTVTLSAKRNAIRLRGELSEKRTQFDQRATAKTLLKTWLAEKIDDDIFTQFDTSPTSTVFGGAATSVATLDSTMLITPAKIDTMVAKAKKASPKIWPVRVGGADYYVLVIHTDIGYDVRNNSVWQGYQQNGAQLPGLNNPIFSGRFGVYNGVVVHEHEKVPIATDGGAAGTTAYASCPFLGRQAGIYAWGKRPQAWEKEFNYGWSMGFAIGAIWKFKKALFNAADHATIAGRFARTNN